MADPKDEKPVASKELGGKGDKKKDDAELSEEDYVLQTHMELLVSRTSNPELCLNALETMVSEVRTSTSSMTSVPKPLKFTVQAWGIRGGVGLISWGGFRGIRGLGGLGSRSSGDSRSSVSRTRATQNCLR